MPIEGAVYELNSHRIRSYNSLVSTYKQIMWSKKNSFDRKWGIAGKGVKVSRKKPFLPCIEKLFGIAPQFDFFFLPRRHKAD